MDPHSSWNISLQNNGECEEIQGLKKLGMYKMTAPSVTEKTLLRTGIPFLGVAPYYQLLDDLVINETTDEVWGQYLSTVGDMRSIPSSAYKKAGQKQYLEKFK